MSQLAQKSKTKNREERYTKILTNSANEGIISQTDYFDKQIANNDNIEGYYIVKKGDFVYNPRISVAAPCGPINCYHGEETGVMSPLYTVFSIDVKKIERDYVEQFFSSTFWHRYMKSVANYGVRSDRMNLSDEDFFLLPIPMPMRTEQEKIAEILAGQDRVIELKEKLLAEKQKQKKYLMQQLLTGKKRLSGFSGDWKKVLLGDLVQISTGNKNTQDQVVNGKYPFFIRSDEICRINSYSYEGEAILIPGEGKIGEIFHYINGKFDYHQRVYKISDFSCKGKFIFYYLQAFFRRRALSMSAKATVDSLRREMLTDMEVTLPTIQEQTAIAEILSTADKEIELLKKDIEQEKIKKKSLMQLLLTGIVRIKEGKYE